VIVPTYDAQIWLTKKEAEQWYAVMEIEHQLAVITFETYEADYSTMVLGMQSHMNQQISWLLQRNEIHETISGAQKLPTRYGGN